MTDRLYPDTRDDYRYFLTIQTRWMDNDAYGHVNNVTYLSYFDTVVNQYLIDQNTLNIEESSVIGLVVETRCSYFDSISFPDIVHAGLRIARIGTTSATYNIGIFKNDNYKTAARGHFIHTYVDKTTNTPQQLPPLYQKALNKLRV
ncbi:acyl-CoA thioesterase [Coralliovum pocilloporae]|uniref:acyl-CoA thioesterase n=1 Tax=Coralliovum pocilloporae TaxID=3066369 RepID=UPI0033075EC0